MNTLYTPHPYRALTGIVLTGIGSVIILGINISLLSVNLCASIVPLATSNIVGVIGIIVGSVLSFNDE